MRKVWWILSVSLAFMLGLAMPIDGFSKGNKNSGRNGHGSLKSTPAKGKPCGKSYIEAGKTCHKDTAASGTTITHSQPPSMPISQFPKEQPMFDADYEARYPRTYQWNDTRTGTPHLSGRMPYWYAGKFQHPNPPCTIVWQRGAIIDDTCEKDTPKAQQYRQNAKVYVEQRDKAIQEARELAKLKAEETSDGKIKRGMDLKTVLQIMEEPSYHERDEADDMDILIYDYTYGKDTIIFRGKQVVNVINRRY